MAGLTKDEITKAFNDYITNHYSYIEQILDNAVRTSPTGLKEQAISVTYATKILPAIIAEVIALNNQAIVRDIQNMIDQAFSSNNQTILQDTQTMIDQKISL